MRHWFFTLLLSWGVWACSDFDADLAAQIRADLDNSTENLPNLSDLTAQLEQLQQFLANTPAEILRDTSITAQQFRSTKEAIEQLPRQITAYENQFLESHSQLVDLLETYEDKKINTEKVRLKYEEIGTQLTQASNGLHHAQAIFEEHSTQLMKLLATWRAEQETVR